MGTTKLAVYSGALTALGERKLASLTENREPRRVLDDLYDQAVAECIEAGQWHFATRTVQLDSDPDLEPAFGWSFTFTKPTDWVRTVGVSADSKFSAPLIRFVDESDYWCADIDPIFIKYVSNDVDFGLDLGKWPPGFTRYVQTHLAFLACERITQNQSKGDRLERVTLPRARRNALNKDAMNSSTPKFAPVGSWVRARGGSRRDSSDRGL